MMHRLLSMSFIRVTLAAIALTMVGCGGEDPGPISPAGSSDESAQVTPATAPNPVPSDVQTQDHSAPADVPETADRPGAEDASSAIAEAAARGPDRSAPFSPPASRESTAELPAGVRPDESAADCVRRVLEQVRAAYARLDVVDVIMHEQTILGGKEMPPVRHLARFASREMAYIEDQYSRLTIVDGTMFYRHINRPEDFARVPYTGDLSDAVGAFRSASILPIALYAGRDVEYILPTLQFGGSVSLRPNACRSVTDESGRTLTRLHLIGSEADTYVDVDPQTGHIVRIEASFILPDEMLLSYQRRFEFEVVEYDALPAPIVFDATGLQEWPTIQMVTRMNLRPAAPITEPMKPMEPGEQASAFELRTIYGQRFPFEPDAGKYTVLAFWSAAHSETRRFLAEMEALQRWFTESSVDGHVITVNSLDGRAVLDRFEATFDFWEMREWGMPALFDENDDVAKLYRISPIPAAVLIAPDGEVLGVWNGQSRGYQMLVRNLVTGHAEASGDETQP